MWSFVRKGAPSGDAQGGSVGKGSDPAAEGGNQKGGGGGERVGVDRDNATPSPPLSCSSDDDVLLERMEAPPSPAPLTASGTPAERFLCSGHRPNIPAPLPWKYPFALHAGMVGQNLPPWRVVLGPDILVLRAHSVPGESQESCAEFVEEEGATCVPCGRLEDNMRLQGTRRH